MAEDARSDGEIVPQSRWWTSPQRMVQTNLREIDADLNPDKLIDDLRDVGATVLLFNVGGIIANYPTTLDCHRRNPYLTDDLVDAVLERCHRNGMRFLARFDFSKANRQFYPDHPDWFYRTAANTVVDYNGQLHTCVNGSFQQECSLQIVGEVLDRYPIDGMFFNMFGYQTSDYSENYHGLCYCTNCRDRFREYSGHDLPRREDDTDPLFRLHQKFRAEAVQRLQHSIVSLADSKRGDEILVSRSSLVRRESNTKLSRPLPLWVYEGSDHTRSVVDSRPGKAVAAAAVHFLDIPYRHVSVPPQLTALRLAQDIAGGGWLDFYCIGTLDGQEDRPALPIVRELYHYHASNEQHYDSLVPAAKTAVLKTDGVEYRGIFRALTENHWPFAVLEPDAVHPGEVDLASYEAVIVPDGAGFGSEQLELLDTYVAAGGRLMWTGRLPTVDAPGPLPEVGQATLACLGVEAVTSHDTGVRSAYFRIDDKETFRVAGRDVDLTWVDDYYQRCGLKEHAVTHLRFVPPSMYGPPEKCYYTAVSDEPGVVSADYGRGRSAVLPWPIGSLYYRQSSPTHAAIVVDTLESLLGVQHQLRTNASPMVEVTLHRQPKTGSRWLMHCVNSSGHHGTAFHEPVTMANLEFALRGLGEVRSVRTLWAPQELSFETRDDHCEFSMPKLDLLEGVVIECDG